MSLYSNKLEFGGYATSQTNSRLIYIDSETAITDTNWHHFAGVRSGDTLYLFLDGVNEGTVDVAGYTFINSPYKMAIGKLGEYGGDHANGWIDEFRFSKGIARWTDNFIPPIAEYPFVGATPTPLPSPGVDDAYTTS